MKNKIIQIFSLFFLFFLLSWNGIAQATWYVNDNSTTGDVYTTAVEDGYSVNKFFRNIPNAEFNSKLFVKLLNYTNEK